MATTTNYSWVTPDDTSLVKDGAAAIRTLGSSIDTTVFANASAGIPKTIVDAKGDLIAATAADTVSRLAVGTNDQVLIADSTAATGLKWGTIAAGAYTSLASGTLSSNTLTISSISSAYTDLRLYVTNVDLSGDGDVMVRFNGETGSNYAYSIIRSYSATSQVSAVDNKISTGATQVAGTAVNGAFYIEFPNYANTNGYKRCDVRFAYRRVTSLENVFGTSAAGFPTASAVSSITIFTDAGSWTGNYQLYGVK
jgi:hypothetical protein